MIVLKNTAQSSLGSTKGSVKHVNKLGWLSLDTFTVGNIEATGLEVGTVGAGDEFSVFSVTGEPTFKIVFLGSSIV